LGECLDMKSADRTSLACTETWTFLFSGFV